MSDAASGASGRLYLPGLNGIRFLAASMVLVCHVEQGKGVVGLPSLFSRAYPLFHRGELGVTLFFVLSGYLITYLLLTEIQLTGTVSIPKFYIRRILRIWPLYYLVVALAWVVLPLVPLFNFPMFRSPYGPDYLARIAFFLLLCPQLAFPHLVTPTPAGPLWSVGVEEQFYAFWPWLVRKFKFRIVVPSVCLILVIILTRIEVRYLRRLWRDTAREEWLTYAVNVLEWSRFSCMMIGAIAAWAAIKHRDKLAVIFRRDVQAVSILTLVAFLVFGVSNRFADHETYSVLFAMLILNVSQNPRSLVRLENPLCNFMGEISYGLYVYHWFIVVLILNVFQRMGGISNLFLQNLFIYTGVIGVTLAVASASYRWFERPFLRMKESFAVVLSGSAARGSSPAATPGAAP